MGQKSFRKNRWPYILIAYYQTLTSVSVKHGQNSPRLGLTNQPRKSRDVKREPLKLVLYAQLFSAVLSVTTLNNASVADLPGKKSKTLVYAPLKLNNSASASTSVAATNLLKTSRETYNVSRNTNRNSSWYQRTLPPMSSKFWPRKLCHCPMPNPPYLQKRS